MTEPIIPDLRAQIMNLPLGPLSRFDEAERLAYLAGHRDARHAAAELAALASAQAEPAKMKLLTQPEVQSIHYAEYGDPAHAAEFRFSDAVQIAAFKKNGLQIEGEQ